METPVWVAVWALQEAGLSVLLNEAKAEVSVSDGARGAGAQLDTGWLEGDRA